MGRPVRFTRSTLIVLDKLAKEGPMSPNEIAKSSGLAQRTVTMALRTLQKKSLCKKLPNLQDMRKPLYRASINGVNELKMNPEFLQSLANLQVTK
ncbi:MarR family transcriptional regulator [Candidatus Thorarchaeota archaeon]|nr:MAG: MarR family transcriptional regulator [Candidatus Thorarchaeota archaeon]